MVMVTVEISKQVEAQARRLGLLSGERLAALIEAEVERQQRLEAAAHFLASTEDITASFRTEYGHLSDDEAQALLNQWIEDSSRAADEQTP